jgi:hypothetical protein
VSVDQLRPFVRRLAERASARTLNYMATKARTAEEMQDAFATLVEPYAHSAALLTSEWYEDQGEEDSRFQALVDDDLAEKKLNDICAWVFAGPQLPENRARQAAHRLVFDAARRTVFVSADSEGVAIARHESSTECKDCQKAATRANRHRDAGSEGVDQFFHPFCEGLFVPVRGEMYTPPGYMDDWPRHDLPG